ncbi:MAG: hypothetical protein P8Y67_12230 [Alphaproteobacteria bacterium]
MTRVSGSPDDWNQYGISLDQVKNPSLLGLDDYKFFVYQSCDALPSDLVRECAWERGKKNRPDIITPLQKGKAWLFEQTSYFQPRASDILLNRASELYILQSVEPYFGESDYTLFMVAEDRCIVISCNFRGSNYEDGDNLFGWHDSMLPDLAKAYYWRHAGLSIPVPPTMSAMWARQLPIALATVFENVVESYNSGETQEAIEAVCQRFGDTSDFDEFSKSFRCWLDTRPEGVEGPVGDQLLSYNTEEEPWDQNVYHIHDGDWRNLRILEDPVEALDLYVEHTLLRRHGRFDFLPYSKILDASLKEI